MHTHTKEQTMNGILYTRVSTTEQADSGAGLAAQVAAFDLSLYPAFDVPVGTSGALQVVVGN